MKFTDEKHIIAIQTNNFIFLPYLSKINVKNKKEQFELKVKDKMNNKKIY